MSETEDERSARRELIRRLLFERDQEGLTLAELSQRSGVPSGTLASWAARLRREAEVDVPIKSPRESVGFVELVPADRDATGSRFEVVLKGERRVVVPASFDDAALVRLVRTLETC